MITLISVWMGGEAFASTPFELNQSSLSVGTSNGYQSSRLLNTDGQLSSFQGPRFGLDLTLALYAPVSFRALISYATGVSANSGTLASTAFGGGLKFSVTKEFAFYADYLRFNHVTKVAGVGSSFSHNAIGLSASYDFYTTKDFSFGAAVSYAAGSISKNNNPDLLQNSGFDRFEGLITVAWSPSSVSLTGVSK